MERDVRATKREIEAQRAIGGDTTALEAKKRRQINEYHKFSEKMEISPKDNRLRVVRGSSELKKSTVYNNELKARQSGALNNKNDPLGRKREKHAEQYYVEIQNRKSKYVISNLSKNANISEKEAKNIYEHIFVNEHKFKDGSEHKFYPDYDMSESFRRLLEGSNIKPHDIIMIKHENLELNLMKKYNMIYEDAHNLTVKKYDYAAALREFLRKVGD